MAGNWIRAEWPAPESIVAGTTLRNWDESGLPVNGSPVWLKQVHGNRVVPAEHCDEQPEADASVSSEQGYVCVVRTADCLPVLFCTRDGTRFAAAHAGWRGLASGVLENTVAALGADPAGLLAWFGPAISQPAFEVGAEVKEAFVSHDAAAEQHFAENDGGRWQADLYGLAAQRLASVGVTDLYGGGLCTWHDEERFFSYRRSRGGGRMFSFIGAANP